jgi:hypothetical protein
MASHRDDLQFAADHRTIEGASSTGLVLTRQVLPEIVAAVVERLERNASSGRDADAGAYRRPRGGMFV